MEKEKRTLKNGLVVEMSHGKVRDIVDAGKVLAAICSNRISAFERILPREIRFKGAILNIMAANSMMATVDIVDNCYINMPHPRVSLWVKTEPFKVEFIVRARLTGSSWRLYKAGERKICDVELPDGMVENQEFPTPIFTPTTKEFREGKHDENITKGEIISLGLMTDNDYELVKEKCLAVFARGQELATLVGLILVDTKYEFGKDAEGKIRLIDEVHTPDSSRYFYLEGFEEKFARGESPKQLSKEFVREWLIERGFKGNPGEEVPKMTDEFCEEVTDRYIELFEATGNDSSVFPENDDDSNLWELTENAIIKYLSEN